ncbi:hypothetical protein [Aquimarina algicola]|uniref:Uncharacterized protein n=1 Tax=Aquimarina algicola TaxID=2589995 RepID=A0A504J105_9FLAO|nr:hypothetical protein [Aquimarina algicola]TPN84516.1 hypothetical protein FHK87_16420 [Aquimarina algicola]
MIISLEDHQILSKGWGSYLETTGKMQLYQRTVWRAKIENSRVQCFSISIWYLHRGSAIQLTAQTQT